MTPQEVGARVVALAGEGTGGAAGPAVPSTFSVTFGEVTVDVPPGRWVAAARACRDDPDLALAFFDWLSAVDETDGDPPGFAVVTHLYSLAHRHHVLLRTLVPAAEPALPSLTGVFPGAGWHERETREMFGVEFPDHPDPEPLLLPDGFEGTPLRKDFVLAARVVREWPGAREPGESRAGRRARLRPPGVPEPGTWGPQRPGGGAFDG